MKKTLLGIALLALLFLAGCADNDWTCIMQDKILFEGELYNETYEFPYDYLTIEQIENISVVKTYVCDDDEHWENEMELLERRANEQGRLKITTTN